MRILVCGDRNWTDYAIIARVIYGYESHDGHVTVIAGAARGADQLAAEAVRGRRWMRNPQGESCYELLEFPADWGRYGRAAGPIRNQQMLDEGKPQVVHAFHDNLDLSKGTKDMMNRARNAGLPVYHTLHTK